MVLLISAPTWALTVWGIDINGVEFQSSVFSIQNTVGDGAPDPVVNTLGLSVPFRFSGHWTVRPEVQAFILGYKYQDGRAVPESAEFDNVSVLSLMINPTGGYEFPLSPTLTWNVEGGLGILARLPLYLNGTTAGPMALPVTGWLVAGRLFYPNVATAVVWQFSPVLAAVVRGQLFYPIFDLWNGLPWNDELTYGVGIGIRLTF